jgi:GTP-binding protein HflX
LVEAFQATLDETVHADLLLHVVDAASVVREEQILEVEKVIAEIGAQDIPVILIMNKIDQLPEYIGRGPEVRYEKDGSVSKIYLSAQSGEGLDLLREVLSTIAQDTDKIRKEVRENNDLINTVGERPLSSEYLEGLKNMNVGYLPRDI